MASINVAVYRTATTSGTTLTNAAFVTNNSSATADYSETDVGLQYVQVDLGAVYPISSVKIWHYWSDGRTYYATRTQISDDGVTWTDVYNSAVSGTYAETSAGVTRNITTTNARYVRDYINGSTANVGNHWVEIQAFADIDNVLHVSTDNLKKYRRERTPGSLTGNSFPKDGLISYWQFENNLTDSVGSNDGTGSGIAYSTGKHGNGVVLDATTDYVKIPAISNSTITIAGWYYYQTANTGNWNTVFCRDGGSRHHILINGDSREIGFFNGAWYSSGVVLTTGNWYYILAEKSGTNQKIYLNNTLILETDLSFNNADYPFSIIGNYYSVTPSQGARGTIDEVGVWDRALTDKEKTYLYKSGAGISFYD